MEIRFGGGLAGDGALGVEGWMEDGLSLTLLEEREGVPFLHDGQVESKGRKPPKPQPKSPRSNFRERQRNMDIQQTEDNYYYNTNHHDVCGASHTFVPTSFALKWLQKGDPHLK